CSSATSGPRSPFFIMAPPRRTLLRFLVGTHQLCLTQNVALHHPFEIGFFRILKVAQHRVQSVELVVVAVAADRRTRATVPGALPIIDSFASTRRKLLDSFGQACRGCRHIIQDPMHPGHLGRFRIGRVGIIHDESEAAGPGGSSAPLQSWTDVVSFAGVLPWYSATG